jgi:saccharopine dehydrogenase-like NADP-dependent oxidoreductase
MAIKIGILGAGKIGLAIAALLDVMRLIDSVILADVDSIENLDVLRKARFRKLDVRSEPDLENFVNHCDAIVSAAPYYFNKTIAQACARFGRSYFDLTEDVDTANFVRSLAAESRSTFMPQCGLAPGAINIIASRPVSRNARWRTAAFSQ